MTETAACATNAISKERGAQTRWSERPAKLGGGEAVFPHAQRALSDGPIVRNPLSLVPALVARTASTSEAGT